MHELGIMQNIVSAVEEYAVENGITKIAKVIVEVGQISGVVPESLEFCFGVCAKDTMLEGALLAIERVPAIGRCKKCGEEFDLLANDFTCSSCQEAEWDVLSGKELVIKGLEVG
jgi:hydrogenase nickel incorporation protein HypA/HybF